MMQVQGIGLATPGEPIDQSELLELALAFNATAKADRVKLKRIYRGSKVQQRHSVLSLPSRSGTTPLQNVKAFYSHENSEGPSTRERMRVYEEYVTRLSTQACHAALQESGTHPEKITQLVTVSCTGFTAPGQDAGLIKSLGLNPTVGRTHIGFMGCHAALNAMRVANAFIRAEPSERVLLCCTELCTLHFQYGNNPQDAVANALFADGSAALVAGHRDPTATQPCTRSFHAEHLPATHGMMSWRIADHGFQMRLEPRVPGLIQQSLKPSIDVWLARLGLSVNDIEAWAIHPGGPKIIDAVQEGLGLAPAATQFSREILRAYGNMSSPTVLFILDALIREAAPKPWVVLGFGPGLAVEAALLI